MEPPPLILFVPGLRPKPDPATHTAEMLRCLLEGIRRINPQICADLESLSECFEVVAWNFPFYGEYHDIEVDRPGIEAVLQQQTALAIDRAEAGSWRRRILRGVYKAADRLPFLIPQLATEKMELHLQDLLRYVRNRKGIADSTRRLLVAPLLEAAAQRRPTLLIGHSMGSVIASDVLWQLSHELVELFQLDLYLTLGTPLGQKYIQNRLLGSKREGVGRFPTNISNWINIAAVGDLTAIDMEITSDFLEMKDLGLIDDIRDYATYNYFRNDGRGGELNVHAEYGYLINDITARVISDWWATKRGL